MSSPTVYFDRNKDIDKVHTIITHLNRKHGNKVYFLKDLSHVILKFLHIDILNILKTKANTSCSELFA